MAKHRWPTAPPSPGRPDRLQRLLEKGRQPGDDPLPGVEPDHGQGQSRENRRWAPGRGAAAVLLGFCLTAGLGFFLFRDWTAPPPVSVHLDAERSADTSGMAAPGAGDDAASKGSLLTGPGAQAGGAAPGGETAGDSLGTDPGPVETSVGESTFYVHVAGAVRRPGVVIVSPQTRVFEAIEEAGGALARAELSGVNLAATVTDGAQIWVPSSGESASPYDGTAPGAALEQGAGEEHPINLNTATALELEALPRVGPVLAGRIVEWRTDHGAFTRPEDLDAVSGIGPAMLEALLPLVTV